ncbi:MAG: SURF1 family protein [Pseudomonadota bacterium]
MTLVIRPILWILTLLALGVLLSLGTWQVKRLAWKTDLIAKVEARIDLPPTPLTEVLETPDLEAQEYLPVIVSGGFPNARIAHVFGTHEGAAGYFAFAAMRLDDGSDRLVLVNRGFVPQDALDTFYPLPDAGQLQGLIRLYTPEKGLAAQFAPPNRPDDGIFFGRDPIALARYLTPGEEDNYVAVAVDSTLPTTLPQGGTTLIDFRNAHLGYAITWYGLAAGLIGVVGALSLKRR